MHSRPPIAIVAHDAGGVGGMETQVRHLACGLADRGYPVTVVACTCTFAGHPGVRWRRVRAPRASALRLPWFALAATWGLWAVRPRLRIATGAILPVPVDIAVIHFCHHAYRQRHGHRQPSRAHPLWRLNARLAEDLSLLAERWCYRPRRSRQLVAVSAQTATELRAIPGRLPPCTVVENGVDTARFHPDPGRRQPARRELGLPEDVPLALFVGGDWALKRPHLAVAALAGAPGWHLVVVGSGDQGALLATAAACGVRARLHLAGRQPDPYPYYLAADVLVHPSQSEAGSLVLLEAQACGLPVVTTLENTFSREMERRGAGVRVDATAAAIAVALVGLLDTGRRQSLGARARALAAEKDWSRALDRFARLIEARLVPDRPAGVLEADAR